MYSMYSVHVQLWRLFVQCAIWKYIFEAIVIFPLVWSVNVGFLRSFGVVFDVSCVLPADANSVLRYFALKAATFALYT